MQGCVAITRSGFGSLWRFETPHEARIHPLIQYGDAVVGSADDLLDEYCTLELPSLLARIGQDDMRGSLVQRMETLKQQGKTARQVAEALKMEHTHTDVFEAMLRASSSPPDSAARVLELVRSDREWDIDHRKKRNTTMADAKKEKTPKAPKEPKEAKEKAVGGHPLTAKLDFGTGKSKDKDGKDVEAAYHPEKNNPKRGGAAERFKKYTKGITIADAIAAGMTPGNVAHDIEKGYVVVRGK